MPRSRVAFGPFQPDGVGRDTNALVTAENVLPLHQSHRPIEKLVQVNEAPASDTDPITGGIAHPLSGERDYFVILLPNSDDSITGDWRRLDSYSSAQGYDLYTEIDDNPADSSDGVAATSDGGEKYRVTLQAGGDSNSTAAGDHVLYFQYAVYGGVAMSWTLIVRLLEDVTGTPTQRAIKTVTGTGPTNGYITDSHTLTAGEMASIVDWSVLYMDFDVDVGSQGNQSSVPTADSANPDGWTRTAGGTALYEVIDEGTDLPVDADYILSPTTPAERGHRVLFELDDTIVRPILRKNHLISFRSLAVKSGATDPILRVRVYGSSAGEPGASKTLLFSDDITVTWTGFTTKSLTLTEAQAQAITNYENLILEFVALLDASGEQIQISAVQFEADPYERIEVTAARYEYVRTDTEIERRGDYVRWYVGTKTQLYQIDEFNSWTEVTRTASDYGSLTPPELPHSWSFCSWGDDVIATNFVDAVQTKGESDADFSDLIVSTDKPRAKFCGVVGQHLVLANIDPDSVATVGDLGPYTVCWSHIDDSSRFSFPDLAQQSDFQPLRETPGEIMQFVGGEFGLILKRNAVYRMDYVGAPLIMAFRLLAIGEGTPWPRSVVTHQNTIYFLGRAGIHAVVNGEMLADVGLGQVWRKMFDYRYQAESIDLRQGSVVQEESTVFGRYDPQSGLIIWTFRVKGQDFHRGVRQLWYSPKEDRFGWSNLALDAGHYLVEVLASPALEETTPHTLRGMALFTLDPAASGVPRMYRFEGSTTEPVTLVTEVLSSASVVGGDVQGRDIQINAVRPLFLISGTGYLTDYITGTVDAGQHPLLQNPEMSTAFTSADQDQDGMIPVSYPVTGEYFRFSWTFPPLSFATMTSLIGFEVDWEMRGRR